MIQLENWFGFYLELLKNKRILYPWTTFFYKFYRVLTILLRDLGLSRSV